MDQNMLLNHQINSLYTGSAKNHWIFLCFNIFYFLVFFILFTFFTFFKPCKLVMDKFNTVHSTQTVKFYWVHQYILWKTKLKNCESSSCYMHCMVCNYSNWNYWVLNFWRDICLQNRRHMLDIIFLHNIIY